MSPAMQENFVPVASGPVIPGVRWFFTTRQGGVSGGVHESWNLGGHVGDDPALVAANRRLLTDRLGVAAEALFLLNQVHGATTREARHPWGKVSPDGDALVTRQPGSVLAIMVADCVPVLLADGPGRVVGAAHAGWQGALAGVVESCLKTMVQRGATPGNIQAMIGPCIRPAAYQVGQELRHRFLEQDPHPGVEHCFTLDRESDTLRLDLPAYVRLRLARWGIDRSRTHDVELCTYATPELFFSHRRACHEAPAGTAPRCGRQVGGIVLL